MVIDGSQSIKAVDIGELGLSFYLYLCWRFFMPSNKESLLIMLGKRQTALAG
jgi:hypothetical protein